MKPSLTGVIKDGNHPVTRFIQESMRPESVHVVEAINQILKKITPLKEGEFEKLLFPKIGTAMTYAIKDYLTDFTGNPYLVAKTIAGMAAKELEVTNKLLDALFVKHPLRYLAMAELEQYYRGGEIDLIRKGMVLPPQLEDTANDLQALVEAMPSYLSRIKDKELAINLFPTFDGSAYIPADAQMVLGSAMVDIKTSLKRQPMTTELLVQQLGYVGFDTTNRYGLSAIAWIFPRHQKFLLVPIDSLLALPIRQFQIQLGQLLKEQPAMPLNQSTGVTGSGGLIKG